MIDDGVLQPDSLAKFAVGSRLAIAQLKLSDLVTVPV